MSLPQNDLAKALGVHASAVTRMKARGMPVDNIAAAQAWRAENVRPRAGTAPGRPTPPTAAPATPAAAPTPAPTTPPPNDYAAARARREQADAERAEIEVAKMAGRLVDRARVEAAVFDAFRSLRDRVMNVPRRCASLVVGLTDAREIELAIADELRAALGGDDTQAGRDLAAKVSR